MPVEAVAYSFSRNKLSFPKTHEGHEWMVDYNLDELDQMLDGRQFFRLNRQVIAGLRAVDKVHLYFNHKFKIQLLPPFEEVVGYSLFLLPATLTPFHRTMTAQLLYQERLTLFEKHTLVADASLPVLAAVSRMPYGNVVSEPGRSNTSAFPGGTRLVSPLRFLNP